MSCDICGRGSCASWFHSGEEQQRFENVIELFDRARELRTETHKNLDDEALRVEEGNPHD